MTDKEQSELAELRELRDMIARMLPRGERDPYEDDSPDDREADASDSDALASLIVKARVLAKRYKKRFRVELVETVRYSVEVEAASREEAEDLAQDVWAQSKDPISDFNRNSEGVEMETSYELTE